MSQAPGDDDRDVVDAEPAPRQLGYRSGIDDRDEQSRTVKARQVILAFFGAGAGIFAAGFFGAVFSNQNWGGLVGVIAACVVLGGVAFGIQHKPKHNGWLLGIVVAIGVVGLLDGICFIASK